MLDDKRFPEIFVRGWLKIEGELSDSEIVDADIERDVSFHDFCALFHVEDWYRKESKRHDFHVSGGLFRKIGQYWPVFMVAVTLVVLPSAELDSDLDGLSAYAIEPTLERFGLLVGLFAVIFGLLYLLRYNGIVKDSKLLKSSLFYLILGVIASGTLVSIYLVYGSGLQSPAEGNVVFVFGYLFAVTVGGTIAYDTMVRTENLLWHLDQTSLIDNVDAYGDFKSDLDERLEEKIFADTVPVAVVFAALFVTPFGVFWYLTDGPQGLGFDVGLLTNILIDFLLMYAVFKFLVIISHFRYLLTGGYRTESGTVELQYQPFHPDESGGFRDIGRAAMRVNLILIIGGLYYTYRLFVNGVRTAEPGMFDGTIDLQIVLWAINYLVPILLYALLVSAWMYFTFWKLHVIMARKRERLIQQKRLQWDDTPANGSNQLSNLFNGKEVWADLRDAPVWPIDRRQLTTVFLANALPVLITLSSLLFN